jgi:hypothetical protein
MLNRAFSINNAESADCRETSTDKTDFLSHLHYFLVAYMTWTNAFRSVLYSSSFLHEILMSALKGY